MITGLRGLACHGFTVLAMVGNGVRGGRGARSPGLVSARRLFALHERSERTGVPVAEVLGAVESERACERAVAGDAGGQTRRELLIGAGGLAAPATTSASTSWAATTSSSPG
jgi:hypothetical protein